MARTYDLNDDSVVVVIGSGAGGGIMSAELAKAGIDVVCLETGSDISITTDAGKMWNELTWLDPRVGSGDLPANFPIWSAKGVGGTTLHWTAGVPRYSLAEMKPTRYFGTLDGVSSVDWPIDYAELESYYDRAEYIMGVCGTHGRPLLPESGHFKVLEAGAKAAGFQRIVNHPMAINSVPELGRSACLQLGFCSTGCAVGAKWSSNVGPIPEALATDHFELRKQSHVLRVEHDEQGRADRVVYMDAEGNEVAQKARVVCMAANAIDTPRILLNSTSSRFPNGLANHSGHVGRHFTKHVVSIVTSLLPGKVHFERGTQNPLRIFDWVEHDASRGFAGGFSWQQVSFDPASLAQLSRPGAWGRGYTQELEQYENYSAMLMIGEDPAHPDNRVTLDTTVKDRHGMAAPHIHYTYHENSRRMLDFAHARAEDLYEALGADNVYISSPPPSTHNMGTCRMSNNADDGVVDPNGNSFDVPNLYMSDGSQLPSSGTPNPTLTIVALALRQAEHIKQRMSRREV